MQSLTMAVDENGYPLFEEKKTLFQIYNANE
jgi:hypothetical protein